MLPQDAPLGAPKKAFNETYSATQVILDAIARGEFTDLPSRGDSRRRIASCPLCAVGDTPFKLKRQTVHHIPTAGKIVVCVEAVLKPGS